MDSSSSANQEEMLQPFFIPIIIWGGGIMVTSSVLVLYYFIVTRFCVNRRHEEWLQQQQLQFSVAGRSQELMRGVDHKVLQSLPIIPYTINQTQQGNHEYVPLVFRKEQNECAVCLGELQEGEMVRLLPTCRHAFHVLCIDDWFQAHSTCPICRSPVVTVWAANKLDPAGVASANFYSSSSSFSSSSISSTSTLPTAGREEGSHRSLLHHNSDASDLVVQAETSRRRSNVLLRHCISLILLSERSKPEPLLPIHLRRSVSMNF